MFSFFPLMDEMRHITNSITSSGLKLYVGHPPMVRPFERIITLLNLRFSNPEYNHFSHLVNYIGFLCSTILVFVITKRIFNDQVGYAFMAGLLFVTHPINVASVYRIDTISQQYGTVFSLFFFRWLLSNDNKSTLIFCFITSCFAVLMVLSKETALGILFGLPFCAYMIRKTIGKKFLLKDLLYASFIVLVVGFIYVLLRQFYVQSMHLTYSKRYAIALSAINMGKNLLMYLGSLVYTGNSVDLFLHSNNTITAVSFALSIITFIIICGGIYALIKQNDKTNIRIGLFLFLLVIIGIFPAIFITKVNELYSYTGTPYFCMLTALLFYSCYMFIVSGVSNFKYRKLLSYCLVLLFAFLIIWLGYNSYKKLSYAEDSSIKGRSYYEAIIKQFNNINFNKSICLSKYPYFTEKHYNWFVIQDDALVEGIIDLINVKREKTIDYLIEKDSESCRYVLFQNKKGIIQMRKEGIIAN
jgi:hypothetical protein